jgi:hypothetical protein
VNKLYIEAIVSWAILIGYPLLLIVPPVLYMIIARPGFRDGKWIVYLGGLAMLSSIFAWEFKMPHVAYLLIGIVVFFILLLVSAIVWMITAFRKKTFVIGGICTAVTMTAAGMLLFNWVYLLGVTGFVISLLFYGALALGRRIFETE